MANEITFTGSLSVYKSSIMSSAIGRAVSGLLFTMTGNTLIEGVLSVGTSATLIPLGQVASPHWSWFLNKDSGNFIKIRNGASGADLLKLKAGEWAFCPLLDSAVPYAIADTAACVLSYLILSL